MQTHMPINKLNNNDINKHYFGLIIVAHISNPRLPHKFKIDPFFVQFILVQPVFVQSISSNPNLTGLDENRLDENWAHTDSNAIT